jgi:hypothetical protein
MKDIRKYVNFSLSPVILAGLIAMMANGTTANAQTSATAVPGQVTFTKDIAPILQEKCQTCHREGQIAPMSLLTYQQTKAYAREIKKRVTARTMPPWFVDKTIGIQHFQNDISLNDQQIATIAKWVDEGAPEGNPKDMPPAKTWNDSNDWRLVDMLGRQPDLIIKGSDYTVKANYQDQWYRPSTDMGITQPVWVRAVEMRIVGNNSRKVFHHVLAKLYQDETNAPSADVKLPEGVHGNDGADLMEWAIGKNYDIYRPGAGKLLMPGAKISWEYHVHSTTTDVTGHPELGVWLYPAGYTPHYRTVLEGFSAFSRAPENGGGGLGGGGLDIPPNTMQVSEGFTVLKAPARLENFQPHMHLRGKAMALEAILPDGSTQVVSYVGDFHFQWMTNYIYADDAAPMFPGGTIIHVTAWHDNTSNNPNNPNPGQWVGLGDRTIDEMAHAWVNVTYVSQADYDAYAAARKKGANNMGGESAAASTPAASTPAAAAPAAVNR